MNVLYQSNNRGGGVVGCRGGQHCILTARPRGGRASPKRASMVAHASGNDDPRTLQRLVEDLDSAIDREEYELAASLRDEIQKRRDDNRLAVEEANDAFYDAFRGGNYVAMAKIWGSGAHVQCIHPAAECIAGREDVLASWKLILASSQRMDIELEDVRIYATDTQGIVTVVEVVDTEESRGRVVATNIFEKQKGDWKLVLHHGGSVPRKMNF
ncbi:F-box protein SKIP8 [Picochlorum sp. SENEW3]|nr:F-box protein SKIP8 [Picochlorum sp. SENEW3]